MALYRIGHPESATKQGPFDTWICTDRACATRQIDGRALTTAALLPHNKALFISHPNPKYFLFHLSHQIFRRMYGALNVGKKDN
jgi:hypothetical protein